MTKSELFEYYPNFLFASSLSPLRNSDILASYESLLLSFSFKNIYEHNELFIILNFGDWPSFVFRFTTTSLA